MRALAALCALTLLACSGADDPASSGDGGAGGTVEPGGGGADTTSSSAGGHGCFSTETTCDGLCVDTSSHPEHCGGCNVSCASGPNTEGTCYDGQCSSTCAPGFVEEGGVCTNFLGAHEAYPAACTGCNVSNAYSGGCSCPSPASALPLHMQSDCPGEPMRAKTFLELCLVDAVGPDSDFGGAYQIDDADGWCGATAQCRVGNPLAGGACACPEGFDPIALRSIVRLPCDDSEVGTQVVFCGNPSAPFSAFAGAFQVDDLAPHCRVANPWTGDCSCPAGTVDRVYRAMVDGAQGLYGSTFHLCTP